MPPRSEFRRRFLSAAFGFTLVEAVLALGVAGGALLLVSAGLGPLTRLAAEARIQAAADRAADAVVAEDARRRSRGRAGIALTIPGADGSLTSGGDAAWWVDRDGRVAGPAAEWRGGAAEFAGRVPVFEVLAVGHRIEDAAGGPPRRSLVVGWPAADARGVTLPWTERRRRVWCAVLPP